MKKLLLLTITTLTLFANQALVEVAKLEKSQAYKLQQYIGSVELNSQSTPSSATNGIVKKIYFEVGSKVKKGDLLLEIDSDLLDNQISTTISKIDLAKKELENTQKDFQRYSMLFEQHSITPQEFDSITLKHDIAKINIDLQEKELENLKIQKSYKKIYAKIDGIVTQKNIFTSQWIGVGQNIATIVDTSNIDILFHLPPKTTEVLNTNELYKIEILDNKLEAKLHSILPYGDKQTRTFVAKFKTSLEDYFVYTNMESKLYLRKQEKENSLVIKRDAVIKRFSNDVIFIIVDGIATMIPVVIDGYIDDKVSISGDNLSEGMDVVIKGNERVFPNQSVQIIGK